MIYLISFQIAVLTYVICGVLINWWTGNTGWELFPNHEFWGNFPGNVKVIKDLEPTWCLQISFCTQFFPHSQRYCLYLWHGCRNEGTYESIWRWMETRRVTKMIRIKRNLTQTRGVIEDFSSLTLRPLRAHQDEKKYLKSALFSQRKLRDLPSNCLRLFYRREFPWLPSEWVWKEFLFVRGKYCTVVVTKFRDME